MKFSPYSIDHAPRSLPIWQTILDDLGQLHPARIAKVLGAAPGRSNAGVVSSKPLG